ncbi:MAG: FAD binding domain-containing protein [Bryobacterales bacterium]|nr:FAD binding domain-containing protein [Bryobacterales bacterium]
MRAFEYASPTTLKEALGLLGSSWADANILAGGTDQISLMKDDIHTPNRVVNIKGIKELSGIGKAGAGVRIGAIATVDDLLNNAAVRAEYPVLIDAAHGIRSPQIRNMGTVGGDLCQRPRCWYFRNGFGVLGMKDGKSLVTDGQNEFHAIFEHGPARFVSASSFGPALVALGATLTIASATGNRKVEAAKFFVAPGSDSQREVDLKPNEILTEIVIPAARGAKSATYEVRQREAMDWPLATASVVLKMKGNKVDSARVVLGHVAAVPHVAAAAEQALAGQTITADVAEKAGEAATQGASPLSGNAYKVQLVKTAVKRAVLAAAGIKA